MDPRLALRTTRTPVTVSSAEIVHLPDGRAALTGTIGEVGQALAYLRQSGQLVSAAAPMPTGVAGQVLVNVRLAPAAATRPVPVRRQLSTRARYALAGGALAALAALAGCGWMLHAAVTAILEHAAVIVGALALVAVVLVLIGRATGRTFSGTFSGRME